MLGTNRRRQTNPVLPTPAAWVTWSRRALPWSRPTWPKRRLWSLPSKTSWPSGPLISSGSAPNTPITASGWIESVWWSPRTLRSRRSRDTIDRAREHGELEEGFKAVADQLERAVTLSGLTRFGAPGEAFDPNLHEALSHLGTDADVEVTTIKHLAKAGYLIGDRVVRAAQVLVVDPAED